MAQSTCRYCAIVFESRWQSRQVICGAESCRRAYRREAMALWRTGSPPEPHICKECGQGFDVKQKRLYCSQKCVREAHLRRRRDNEYQPPRRDCDVCGTEIPYKSGKRRYCSAKCQKAGIAKEARWRIKGLDPSIAPAESCQLCGATDRRLVIDHDHACCPQEKACGRCVRGMLCQPCNVGLGMFRESPALLHRAARYLEAGKRDLQSGQLRLVV